MIPRPQNITFHITDRCAYQCVHCWMRGIPRAPGLRGVYYVHAARRLKEVFGDVQIVLDGGDPLTRPDILEIITQMADAGIRVHVNTTGRDVDAEFARRLIDAGVGSMMLSLDGSREVHNRIRRHPEAFESTVAATRHLRAASADLPIAYVTTLQAQNIDDVPDSLGWVFDDPKSFIQFQAISNPGGGDAEPEFLANDGLWPPAPPRARSAIDRIIRKKRDGFRIKNPESQLRLFATYFERPGDFTAATCRADEVGLLVDSFGSVKLCNDMEPVGSIVTDDIVEILQSPRASGTRVKMRSCKQAGCHLVLNCFYDEAVQATEATTG